MRVITEIHHLTALDQAAAIRRHEIRPLELVEHYLARIEEFNTDLGAFVTVTADRAIDAAKEAERHVGTDAAGSPLFGVPTAIKDLNLVAGVPTRFGSLVANDFVAPIDDNVVSRIRDAGLVSLGKTNTPEFGLTCYTEPEVAPPARTPFDPRRSAGGSSGGAGAAVSAGLAPVAQGSDGAGSIRIPASVCGLVGLKPSRGRVSGGPVVEDSSGLAVNGPLARTVADAAALLDVMAGRMPGDPYWAPPLPDGATFLAATKRPPGHLRIGLTKDPVIADARLDAECDDAFAAAASLFEELGHEVGDCPRLFPRALVPEFELIWAVGAASIPVPPGKEEELRPITRWLRERGKSAEAARFVTALATVQAAARQAIIATSSFDVVATPTLAQKPAYVGAIRDDEDPEHDFEAQKRFTPFTAPANLTGQPAISLPLYWTEEGLPIGVQLIGRPAGEYELLALAAELERARPWAGHVPPMW
ncbi:MAG: amidase [Acidimicrobiales bacterium]